MSIQHWENRFLGFVPIDNSRRVTFLLRTAQGEKMQRATKKVLSLTRLGRKAVRLEIDGDFIMGSEEVKE